MAVTLGESDNNNSLTGLAVEDSGYNSGLTGLAVVLSSSNTRLTGLELGELLFSTNHENKILLNKLRMM